MADQQHLPRRRSSTFDRASVEGTLNPTRRPRPRQYSSSTAMSQQSHRTRTRTNSGSMYSAATPDSAYSDEEPEWEHGEEVKVKRKKKDEPMSPVVVVLYVAAFYLIFQILTRSDELEILSHLPPTSALFSGSSPLAFSGGPNYRADGSSNNYHLPYHLPHLPSPVPAVSGSENGGSVSVFRIILGIVMYPLYLAITLLAIPVPLLLNTLHLVLHILFTILYPVTSTGRLIARTFILGPLAFVGDILSVFYPVYTFVGGVIGLGCVMGLGAGWLGKISMDLLIHGRVSGSKKSSKRNKSGGSSKSRSTKSKSSSSHRKEDRDQDFTHANHSSRQVDASRGKGSARYPIAVETNAIAQKGSSRVPKWDVSPESGHNDETIVTPRQTASRQIHYDSQRSQFEEPFQRDTRSIVRSGGRGHQQHSRYEEDYDPDEDYDQLTHLRGEDGSYDDTTIGRATGRKPQVVATRRRTHMLVVK